jgi:hypothetical protein
MNNNNNFIINKEKQIKNILSVLKKSKISSDNHISSQVPFFSNSNITNIFDIGFNEINPDIPESLNRNIKIIYQLLGDNNKEIYIGDWTIMSINEAVTRYKTLCEHKQDKVFDIGYCYLGMGHIEMVSCDLDTHLLFFRPDGGSNGWDREINLNNLINEGSSPYKKFYFSQWFYKLL